MAKFKWNLPAFEAIRRLPGVDDALRAEVERGLDITGRDNYAGDVEPGATRSRGYIVTSTVDGIRDHRRSYTLLRVMGGGQA